MGFKGLYQVGLGYSHNFPLKLDGHAQDGPRAVPCLGVLRRDGLTYALHTLGQRRQPLMMEPCSSKPVPAATQSPTLAHVAVEAGVAVRVGDVERLARRRDVPRDALRDGHPRHATAARHHWGGGSLFWSATTPRKADPSAMAWSAPCSGRRGTPPAPASHGPARRESSGPRCTASGRGQRLLWHGMRPSKSAETLRSGGLGVEVIRPLQQNYTSQHVTAQRTGHNRAEENAKNKLQSCCER